MQSGGEWGQAQLFDQGNAPDHVGCRRGNRQRAQPDGDSQRIPEPVEADQRPRFRNRKPGAGVERQHQAPDADVGENERRRVAPLGDITDQHGHRGNPQHGAEERQPEGQVVRVEPVRVRHEPLPGHEHRDEEAGEAKESGKRMIDDELVSQLRDRHHEDEVEKEFEPGRVPAVDLVGTRPKLRRPEPEPLPCHGR